MSGDAYPHLGAPAEDGDGAMRAMRMALWNAPGFAPQEVDYINAHGTSTPAGDAIEVRADQEGVRRSRQEAGCADRPSR